jgi:hypothetical protein
MKLLIQLGAMMFCSTSMLAQNLQSVTTGAGNNITSSSIIVNNNLNFDTNPATGLHLFYNGGQGVVSAGTWANRNITAIPLILASTATLNQGRLVIGNATDDGSTALQVNGGFNFYRGGGDNFVTWNGSADIRMRYLGRGSGGRAIVHDDENRLTLNYAGDFSGGTRIAGNTYFTAKTTDSSFVMCDRIGIGTMRPTARLSVKGTVLAEKVVVSVAASDWPDYVFDSTYHLPSLQETKSYVNINKHLPDFPSASEMEKEGQDLGKINQILVQKLEEMTLHLIRMEERLAELEKEKRGE